MLCSSAQEELVLVHLKNQCLPDCKHASKQKWYGAADGAKSPKLRLCSTVL